MQGKVNLTGFPLNYLLKRKNYERVVVHISEEFVQKTFPEMLIFYTKTNNLHFLRCATVRLNKPKIFKMNLAI